MAEEDERDLYVTQEFEFYSDDEHLISYNFPETYELGQKTYQREEEVDYETLGTKESVQAAIDMNVEELSEVPDTYTYESKSGHKYELSNDQIYIKSQGLVEIPVIEEVHYENQAGRPSVPSKKIITYYDKKAGKDQETEGYLKELIEERAGRWISALNIDGTFLAPSEDCGEYELAGTENVKVARDSAMPVWPGYETDILASLNLKPEYYRITGAAWRGDAYWSQEGYLCRNALFTGDMFAADYKAVYQAYREAQGYSTRVYYRADASDVDAPKEDITTLYRIKAVVKYRLLE